MASREIVKPGPSQGDQLPLSLVEALKLTPLIMPKKLEFGQDIFRPLFLLLSCLGYDFFLSKDRLPSHEDYCKNKGCTKHARREQHQGLKLIVFDLAQAPCSQLCGNILLREIKRHAQVLLVVEKYRRTFGLNLQIPRLYIAGSDYVVAEIPEMSQHSKFATEVTLDRFARQIGVFMGLMIWYLKVWPMDFETCLSDNRALYFLDFGGFKMLHDIPSLEQATVRYRYIIEENPLILAGLTEVHRYFHPK